MLNKFYGFFEQPFEVTPDSRSLFLSRTHREALAALTQGIEARRGFLTLIAKPGMGKTTILYQLMERLRGSARVAFLFQTQCTSLELVRYLMADLGLDSCGKSLVEMQTELCRVLFEKQSSGSQFVLFVDESQNLSLEALETIRLLSNCETPHTKLMQIVLAGQPQLADKLTHPDLHQLHQRIAVVSELTPFGRDETISYVRNRLQAAGYRGGPLFTPSALDVVAKRCDGIPRKINMLCFNSLSIGYALRRSQINDEIVKQALIDADIQRLAFRSDTNKDLEQDHHSSPPTYSRRARAIGGMKMHAKRTLARGAALLTMMAVGGLFTQGFREEPLLGRNSIQDTLTAGRSTDPRRQDRLPLTAEQNERVDSARLSVASSFDLAESKSVIVGRNETIRQIARKYLGRDDARALQVIQALNPQLTNMNRITEGEHVLIPKLKEAVKAGPKKGNADSVEKGSHE